MTNQVQVLRSQPIRRSADFAYDDYLLNKAYYHRQIICKLPVDQQHALASEPLISCALAGLLIKNYYWQSKLLQSIPEVQQYLVADVFLRHSLVADLLKIDQFLQTYQLRLLILSGYRHPQLQRVILREVTKIKGADFANRMFANPDFYAPHATGAAVDLEIWDNKNNRILATKADHCLDRFSLEERSDLTQAESEVRANRRLIHNLLTSNFLLAGGRQLVGHPYEYWHYGRHERLSAFFANQPASIYYDVLSLTF